MTTLMSDSPLRIVSFSLVQRRAWASDNVEVPITNIFDIMSDETDDPDLCVRFVAGPHPGGWFAVDVSGFVVALLS
jgi:hypothetical protein